MAYCVISGPVQTIIGQGRMTNEPVVSVVVSTVPIMASRPSGSGVQPPVNVSQCVSCLFYILDVKYSFVCSFLLAYEDCSV